MSDWETYIGDIKPLSGKQRREQSGGNIADIVVAKTTQSRNNQRNMAHKDILFDDSSQISGNIAQQIRRGKIRPQISLDMHGMMREEAYKLLLSAIENMRANNQRLLLAITGKGEKGEGVLRQQLPRWLNTQPLEGQIIFYCHATQSDGGTGAFYIYLRK